MHFCCFVVVSFESLGRRRIGDLFAGSALDSFAERREHFQGVFAEDLAADADGVLFTQLFVDHFVGQRFVNAPAGVHRGAVGAFDRLTLSVFLSPIWTSVPGGRPALGLFIIDPCISITPLTKIGILLYPDIIRRMEIAKSKTPKSLLSNDEDTICAPWAPINPPKKNPRHINAAIFIFTFPA